MPNDDDQAWLDATPAGEIRTIRIYLDGVGEKRYTWDRRASLRDRPPAPNPTRPHSAGRQG